MNGRAQRSWGVRTCPAGGDANSGGAGGEGGLPRPHSLGRGQQVLRPQEQQGRAQVVHGALLLVAASTWHGMQLLAYAQMPARPAASCQRPAQRGNGQTPAHGDQPPAGPACGRPGPACCMAARWCGQGCWWAARPAPIPRGVPFRRLTWHAGGLQADPQTGPADHVGGAEGAQGWVVSRRAPPTSTQSVRGWCSSGGGARPPAGMLRASCLLLLLLLQAWPCSTLPG